jgi:hypothetical protein
MSRSTATRAQHEVYVHMYTSHKCTYLGRHRLALKVIKPKVCLHESRVMQHDATQKGLILTLVTWCRTTRHDIHFH